MPGRRQIRPSPRWCYYQSVDEYDENGYIPSIVHENERGHSPLRGNGPLAMPWYWGKTYEAAQKTCARANADLGLSVDDCLQIVASSMRFR